MKKILMVCFMLVIVFVMVGCDNKNNLLTVSFKINEDILLIEKEKGSIISFDDVPIDNVDYIENLYYDSLYTKKYDNELVEQNIKLYVKLKEKSNIINNGKKIKYKINYNGMGFFGYKIVDNKFQIYSCGIINSYEELNNLCKEYNNNFINEYESIYNNEFFKDKSLIIYSFETGYGKETVIEDLILNEEELIIVEKIILKDGFYTTEAFRWMILIEVNKVEIENAKEIKINYE